MSDQQEHRQAVEPETFEDDIRRVLVAIEQDPYDEDGHVIEAFEQWAADDAVTAEQFLDAARRVLTAKVRAERESYR